MSAPSSTRASSRSTSTRVLPEPAAADTSSPPPRLSTAACCSPVREKAIAHPSSHLRAWASSHTVRSPICTSSQRYTGFFPALFWRI